MIITGRDGGNVVQPDDLDRREPRGSGAIAQLAGAVVSPCPHGPVGAQCQTVKSVTCDRYYIREARHRDWAHAKNRRAVAELAVAVVSPAFDVGAHQEIA